MVDVRFNGGGHLTEQLISDLSAETAGATIGRDGEVFSTLPESRWAQAEHSDRQRGQLFRRQHLPASVQAGAGRDLRRRARAGHRHGRVVDAAALWAIRSATESLKSARKTTAAPGSRTPRMNRTSWS